jgi:hypothetical protein
LYGIKNEDRSIQNDVTMLFEGSTFENIINILLIT